MSELVGQKISAMLMLPAIGLLATETTKTNIIYLNLTNLLINMKERVLLLTNSTAAF